MVSIVDRRNKKDKSSSDRSRFIRRCKKGLKDQVDRVGKGRDLADTVSDGTTVLVTGKDISEPQITYDGPGTDTPIVGSGNDVYGRGETIQTPAGGGDGLGRASEGDNGEMDDFVFSLSKDEFLDMYFADMALPDS